MREEADANESVFVREEIALSADGVDGTTMSYVDNSVGSEGFPEKERDATAGGDGNANDVGIADVVSTDPFGGVDDMVGAPFWSCLTRKTTPKTVIKITIGMRNFFNVFIVIVHTPALPLGYIVYSHLY